MIKNKKKIIITGGVGFMGTNTAIHFYNKGWQVFLIDDCSRKGTMNNYKSLKKKIKFKFFKFNLVNYKRISKIISRIKPDLIIHCAAQVAVTKSIIDPRIDFNSNALGTFNVLESIRLYSKKSRARFLFSLRMFKGFCRPICKRLF